MFPSEVPLSMVSSRYSLDSVFNSLNFSNLELTSNNSFDLISESLPDKMFLT